MSGKIYKEKNKKNRCFLKKGLNILIFTKKPINLIAKNKKNRYTNREIKKIGENKEWKNKKHFQRVKKF